MKGDSKVIEYLNKIIANELTAINQYFVHARMLKNWGVSKLASHSMHESIDEMKHAQLLTDRVLFLEGIPNLQMINKLRIGENVKEIIECDLKLEIDDALPVLRDAIQYCESIRDFGTRDVLQEILESEEEHADFLETQLTLVEQMGIQNYVQLQSEGEGGVLA
jgi:bacterioferritin